MSLPSSSDRAEFWRGFGSWLGDLLVEKKVTSVQDFLTRYQSLVALQLALVLLLRVEMPAAWGRSPDSWFSRLDAWLHERVSEVLYALTLIGCGCLILLTVAGLMVVILRLPMEPFPPAGLRGWRGGLLALAVALVLVSSWNFALLGGFLLLPRG